MHKKEVIKKARIVFMVQAVIAALLIALFETGCIASDIPGIPPTTRYIAEVAGVMLTIILIPLAIKGFSMQMTRAAKEKTDHFIEYYRAKSNARTTILFLVIMMNTALYYIMDNNSALYCGLLGIAAAIYSYPTQTTLDSYCNTQEEEKA